MCISNEINNEGNIVSESSINASTIGNNNNNSINVYVQNNSNGFSRNEIHDIEVLERILSCVPKRFNERLETLLLCNRRYKRDELDYVHEMNEKINDTDNYLINSELRMLAEKMGEAFSDLGWKIAGRFAPARDDITYQVLDRPLGNDEKARNQYYDYLTKELPEAINNAFVAYTNLCHKRTELFGI